MYISTNIPPIYNQFSYKERVGDIPFFTPACLPMPELFRMRYDFQKYGKLGTRQFNWWKEQGMLWYPGMLTSAYYGMDYPDYRKEIDLPSKDDYLLIGDSGGFQEMKGKPNKGIHEILRWQEDNCNIGITKDFPIGPKASSEDFTKHMRKSTRNAMDMRKYLDSDMKLYCVYFGRSKKEFQAFHKNQELNEFDGACLGSRSR